MAPITLAVTQSKKSPEAGESYSNSVSPTLSPSIACNSGQPPVDMTQPWLLPPWPPPLTNLASPSNQINAGPSGRRPGDDSSRGCYPEDVVVCQLKSSSMLSISAAVGGHTMRAVVDTAAEVTILSDRLYNALDPKPPVIKTVFLYTAGRDMKMKGLIVGPIDMTLGNSNFSEHDPKYVN